MFVRISKNGWRMEGMWDALLALQPSEVAAYGLITVAPIAIFASFRERAVD